MALRSPPWLYKAGLVLSVSYCVAVGVLALGSSALNGIDLSVCYVAGATTIQGSSPYNYGELTKTRSALNTTLAAKPSLPFAYPPSVIPGCAIVSLLPWDGAQALWKLLNLAFLIGSVVFTLRLFPNLNFAQSDRYLIWSFAFIFSPTVSVLLVGQSSLFVLFAELSTMVLYHLGKSWLAGLGLALALTKPHLVLPLVCLLLFQRQYRITTTAFAIFALLVIAGLYISHTDIDTLLQGIRKYASWNTGANPRLVGIQNLTTGVLGIPAPVGSMLSVLCGLVGLGILLLLDSKHGRRNHREEVLPAVLVISVLGFGAHSYDMVLLIPVFIWAIGRMKEDKSFLTIAILCVILIVPLSAVTIAYEKLLTALVPSSVFHVVIEPFRSWILVLMFVLLMYLTYRLDASGRARQYYEA